MFMIANMTTNTNIVMADIKKNSKNVSVISVVFFSSDNYSSFSMKTV